MGGIDWMRPRRGPLLEPGAWLEEDAQTLLDAGEYYKVRQRLLRWQKQLGRPGDDISGALLTQSGGREHVERVREKLDATVKMVERAYLLNTTFTLRWSWPDLSRWRAQMLWDSFVAARKYSREHGFAFEGKVHPPTFYIFVGFSGSAEMTARGNAWQLQDFVTHFCTYRLAMNVNSKTAAKLKFMRPIPWYSACTGKVTYVKVPDSALHPELITFEEEMDVLERRISERQAKLENLRQQMDRRKSRTRRAPDQGRQLGD